MASRARDGLAAGTVPAPRGAAARRVLAWALVAGGVAALVAGAWTLGRPGPEPEVRASLSVIETLAPGDTAGFLVARPDRPVRLPEDHAAHPDFRNEWWYVTGNLEGEDGRRFGYQLVIFRSALSPDEPAAGGAWSTRQGWMAHFAVTDPEEGRFATTERLVRGALGLAGAEGVPLRVWVEDWFLAGSGDAFPGVLHAGDGGVALDLRLEPLKPPVLHGENGFHMKDEAGHAASHYYSLTRLRTRGTLRIAGDEHDVQGLSWMDREWSTGGLPPGAVGWDWMALQLLDGRDVMLYRMRGDGAANRASGTLVEAAGQARTLTHGDVHMEALEWWESPKGGTSYPVRWRVQVPSAGIDVEVVPVLKDQEIDLTYRYWEGAVDVRTFGSRDALGRGYLEMTGYTGRSPR